jgi:hypothetical protein
MRTLLMLALAACHVPDVGPALSVPLDAGAPDDSSFPAVPGCDNSDSDPATTVSFRNDIRPLMARTPGGCGACHLGRITSGLDLSSYASLRRGGINTGTRVVVPGEPCNSVIVQKIGRTPPFGSRMPFNGPPYFTGPEIQLVSDWIAEGAQNN